MTDKLKYGKIIRQPFLADSGKGGYMAEKNSKNKLLDDFWNIEQLIPQNKLQNSVYPKNTTPVEIEASPAKPILDDSSEFTVKKYIPPYESGNIRKADDFEWEDTYIPDSSLIHRVAVKKYKSSYNYYVGFKKDAVKYKELNGEPCDFVPFFSYVPQYDQMNEKQFRYYLWFRESVRNEKTIKADQGYILLFIFELIKTKKIIFSV